MCAFSNLCAVTVISRGWWVKFVRVLKLQNARAIPWDPDLWPHIEAVRTGVRRDVDPNLNQMIASISFDCHTMIFDHRLS